MKTKIILGLTSLFITLPFQATAEEKVTFGLGLGSLYSGVGGNIGLKSKTDFKYLSAGCVSYSSLNGSVCGAGVGWVKSDLFTQNNTNHGAGLYLGVVGSKNKNFDKKPIYGIGLGYHYFFSGMENSGFNVGATVVAGKENSGVGGMLQVGYQF
ncbi:MAG: hypothetical protein ACPGUD_03215 [Parashewanella sp.]